MPLADDAARRTALTVHDRTFLVEAGAGSGKTAILAGRIALMLAGGIPARQIAAVTFTELAASELVARVRLFVDELAAGRILEELAVAFPNGIDTAQASNLGLAASQIDDLTATTIHGFCQRLVQPYPVEANIDPGATVIDPEEADLRFEEIVDDFLRGALGEDGDGLLAELVLHDDEGTLKLVRKIAAQGRARPLPPHALPDLTPALGRMREAARAYADFVQETGIGPCELTELPDAFARMAAALPDEATAATPAGLLALLAADAEPVISGRVGGRAYQNKGRWGAAAAACGLSKADGDRFFERAKELHLACHDAWDAIPEVAAARVLALLVPVLAPVGEAYRAWKRSAAVLDFDDLIGTARDLLARNEPVRRALGERYAHVLVDEFQDTDPVQTEVFWRLAGDPVDEDWRNNRLRPGALFLVGDPKQAIYRFRGADVAAYIAARDRIAAADPGAVLSISTNFRSLAPILDWVNARFEPVLKADGQPGFTALDPFHHHDGDWHTVAALDVATESEKPSQNEKRDCEAEAVADACARLIGNLAVADKAGGFRPCHAGDIALLAPTGTELWRYEQALEARGIAVASQAGKGLFQRQEVKDLVALARVLADRNDRLALGALLRGPLVGLTDEELLDIVWSLPRDPDRPDALPRLSLSIDPDTIDHPLAREVIGKLRSLARKRDATTPHRLLAEAVDVLRVRPILLARHGGRGDRPLANVDLFLSMARAFDVRGLTAFARAMTAAWQEGSRTQEGRPDAQEGAVTLYTMHSAKGLEWPIVIPINTTGAPKDDIDVLVDPGSGTISCKVFGVAPFGHAALHEAEREERRRERQRLWYVAATRARQLLVLPRLDAEPTRSAWCSLVDLALDDLPALDLSRWTPAAPAEAASSPTQSRDTFRAEAEAIAANQRRINWIVPSRAEGAERADGPGEIAPDLSVEAMPSEDVARKAAVRGSRTRGLVLHKLLEEVLTGETARSRRALTVRAGELITALGVEAAASPADALDPDELASSVERALALPEVAAHVESLRPEFPVYAFAGGEEAAEVTTGIADAVALDDDGRPTLVIDWKSDVHPSQAMREKYLSQMKAYIEAQGLKLGLLVFVTTGEVLHVGREARAETDSA